MKRRAVGVFLIGIAVALAGWVVLFVVARYPQWKGERNVRKTAEALKRLEEEDFQRAMADTYGGKTPQETLAMFIESVEAGDYALASKYFIGEKQGEELESLRNSNRKNIAEVVSLLKKAQDSDGEFSEDEDNFLIRKPLLIDFKLYPNGIWKIIEI